MPRARLSPDIDHESLELIEEFFVDTDLAPLTQIKYRPQLKEWARWLTHPRTTHRSDAPLTVRSAAAPHVQRFLGYLRSGDRYAAATPDRERAALAPSSRKNFLASIRSFYRYLVLMQVVERDPTIGVQSPKARTRPGFRLDEQEIERLLIADGSARDRIVAFLLVFTAARANELRTLLWDNVDFTQRTILLHTKNDEYHLVDIHPRLMVELRRWYLHQATLAETSPALAQALRTPKHAFVLLTRTGRPLAPGALARQLKRRAVRADLHVLQPAHNDQRSLVSPHAIRRSVATMLLNAGEPIDAVADVLHHKQLDTTRRHYAFTSSARRKHTIERIMQ